MALILVTPRSLSSGAQPLLDRLRAAGHELRFPSPGEQPSRDRLLAAIGEAEGYLAGLEVIDAAVLEAAPRLRVIARNGSGVDNIDLAKAAELGVRVLRAEGANARGVAELAFGQLLAAARGLPSASAELKAGRWAREKGFELEGKVLGILGLGRVGKLLARFALAFDMEVLGYDPRPDPAFAPGSGFSYVGLEELQSRAGLLSLHCPPLPGGKPLVDAAFLARLRPGAILVNTARESLVEREALLAALDSGRLAAYAIDAFDREPPEDLGLLRHPRVTATPHLGGYTAESVDRAAELAVDRLLEALGSASD